MKRLFALTLAVTAAFSATAIAAPTSVRLRGTITAISAESLTIKTGSGKTMQVMIGGGTHYLRVEKSDLNKVDKGSYIGTATKTVGTQLIALEVVIFPASMRGTGEGHYAWDKIPDTTLSGGAKTASTMTNGNVAAVSGATGGKVSSTMTNGNVAATASSDGVKRLTVTYKGGEQTILVPPTAPIVKFRPGMKADATAGAHVFIKARETDGKITADVVAVGVDGVTPPM